MPDIHVLNANELEFAGKRYRCAVGSNGFTAEPREGDKATPVGMYPLRECWYRADRVKKPDTWLPLRVIQETDGWCDDPTQGEYNRPVKLPFCGSHENMHRLEHVYDIVIPIGFNDDPVTPGKGSAIMFHLAHSDYRPTLGCVAVAFSDMSEILPELSSRSRIIIVSGRS